MMTTYQKKIAKRIDAAMGRIPCDVVIKNVLFLDVFNAAWQKGEVGIIDGSIVGIEEGLKGNQTIDGKGKWLVPGFIDAHVHLESSLMTPNHFERLVLARGTTTAVCDPHELANVQGVSGIEYFLSSAAELHLNLKVMLSSCVPATHLETNGGGDIEAKHLAPLRDNPNALGLAEMMNIPGVLNNDPAILEKLELFKHATIDGHSPLLRGKELSAYLCAGISSCHETTEPSEAREKIKKGMAIWIREGSVAKDLHALAPLLNLANSPSIGFCTDDRNPLDILDEGHIDFLIREAIRLEVPAEIAYRAASWSVARHYGMKQKGAIAPGYDADLVLLSDATTTEVEKVFCRGVSIDRLTEDFTAHGSFVNSVRAKAPNARELEGPRGLVHVMGICPGKLITEHLVENADTKGVCRISVLERYGKQSPPSNGYARGFGENFDGAIGSSVGHDSHNLIVAGKKTSDMQIAFQALIAMGGGFVVVSGARVVASLPLPVGGLMTTEDPTVIRAKLVALKKASLSVKCELAEPFLQLAFLSLPVIPELKLTDKGLVDVSRFQIISVSAESTQSAKVS